MRTLNTDGPPLLGVLPEPPALQPKTVHEKMRHGASVLDCRSPEAFGGGHIPGALNAGLGPSFPVWAGTVLPADTPYVVVLEDHEDLSRVCWHLLRIGFEMPHGWLAGGMLAWRTAALPIRTMPEWTVWDLEKKRKERNILILDVRQPDEWRTGHIEGAMYLPGAELPKRVHEVPKDRPVAVICGSGYRSSVSASLLLHEGHPNVTNVLGGMAAWKKAGLPVKKE